MMRFILGTLLLALSLLPCADTYAADTIRIHETYDSHAHENRSTAGDLCSPFCVCGCCNTPVVMKFSLGYVAAVPAPLPERQYPVYRLAFTLSFIQNIWQPPQINA
ncbi:DUF6660 family protein [Parapedobacter sp.]|uniref:DUF6660 family protein n=1 Tax=Parapedobacter sp. TaxID=1958893 RepID=UPI0039C92022